MDDHIYKGDISKTEPSVYKKDKNIFKKQTIIDGNKHRKKYGKDIINNNVKSKLIKRYTSDKAAHTNIKDISTILNFLMLIYLKEKEVLKCFSLLKSLINEIYLSVKMTKKLILYLNDSLKNHKLRDRSIELINILYDKDNDIFLYAMKDTIKNNEDVNDLFSLIENNSVLEFLNVLSKSRIRNVQFFFINVTIKRIKNGKIIYKESLDNVMKSSYNLFNEVRLYNCLYRFNYYINFNIILEHLKKTIYFRNLYVYYGIITLNNDFNSLYIDVLKHLLILDYSIVNDKITLMKIIKRAYVIYQIKNKMKIECTDNFKLSYYEINKKLNMIVSEDNLKKIIEDLEVIQ